MSTFDHEDRARAASNKIRVLRRLQQGPATNHELREIGGSRALARVNELQAEGYRIDVKKQDRSTWLVTLQPRRETPIPTTLFDLSARPD